MASRKYASKRKLRRTKHRISKKRYGRKRGGMFGGVFGKLFGGEEEKKGDIENQLNNVPNEIHNAKMIKAEQGESEYKAPSQPLGGPNADLKVGGGRKRRSSKRRRSSKKSRKSRRTRRRKHKGGNIGHAFQPSVVNPPHSALANPAPFARYTTGP